MKKINICMLVILLALGSPLAMAQTVGSPVKVVCNDLVEKVDGFISMRLL